MLRRFGFFILLNFVVMMSLMIIMNVLGVQPYLTPYGLDMESLAIFCLIWGMGGSFISLALSRKIAKWSMKVQVIPEDTNSPEARELVQTIRQLSTSANIPMPEIGIYDSPDINAFATGPTKNRSLVAVSTGLLNKMNQTEVKGVLAHEISHIANGDMVTMTLLQGVVNAFVMFLARVVAFAIQNAMRSDDERGGGIGGMSYFITVFILDSIFMVLGSLVVRAFSRYREYRADAGGAQLAGVGSMVSALEALKQNMGLPEEEMAHAANAGKAINSLRIDGGLASGLGKYFATHPDLDSRISRLKNRQY